MKFNRVFKFKFAGQKIVGKFVKTEKTEIGKLYFFKNKDIVYPVKKENVCGTSTQ